MMVLPDMDASPPPLTDATAAAAAAAAAAEDEADVDVPKLLSRTLPREFIFHA